MGARLISNTSIRDLMRAAARGARIDGNEELRRKASRSGRLIVGRGWSRHVDMYDARLVDSEWKGTRKRANS